MSRYPALYAGERPTADLLLPMIPDVYYKVGNTDRSATTTLADDPDLTTTVEANAVYHVTCYIHFAALDAAQIQTAWTVPAGATGNRSAFGAAFQLAGGANTAVAADGGYHRSGCHGYATPVRYGSRNNSVFQCLALEESIVTTSSAGTLALQWAQAVSNAGATRVAAGSSLHVRRLA